MEKTVRRMMRSAIERDAYRQAEVVTALAHQVRAIRDQRGWTQRELAAKLGTSQSNIARLEDPSYGKLSLSTLLDLARVFDAGLQVKFVSLVDMLNETFHPNPSTRQVPAFEEEAPHIGFYEARINELQQLPATTMPQLDTFEINAMTICPYDSGIFVTSDSSKNLVFSHD